MAERESRRIPHGDAEIDPVTLEVLWSRLRSIPEEMGTHFTRTAFSQVIKYGHDLSTAIFTPEGKLLAQGVYTAGHLGSMPFAMESILEDYFPKDAWEAGDVVITNHPYINSGHLNDIFMFEPVVYDAEVVGYCVTTAHHLDVGGAAPGSYPIEVIDMYGEGLQLPPLKLYEQGQLNEEVMDIIISNSRMSTNIRGDVRAQRGSTNIGVGRFAEVVEEYGLETVETYASEIIRRTERRMRAKIGDLPDGRYHFEDRLDGFEESLPIRVEVTVDGDHMVVDYEGTADQLEEYSINSTWNYTYAYTMLAVKSVIDPDTPQTHGTVGPIEMRAPVDSLVNPSPPVPLAAHGVLADYIQSTVNGALDQVVPGEVPAAAGPSLRLLFKYEDMDENTVQYDGYTGAAGATNEHDGGPAVATSSNIQNTPVEAFETEYPMLIHRYGLVPDTAGPGRYRGGNATVREYEFLSPARVQIIAERFKFGPYGLHGGEEGKTGAAILSPTDEEEVALPSKTSINAGTGDFLQIYTCGGGGYGDPERRERDRVRDDLRNGLITPAQARAAYAYHEERS